MRSHRTERLILIFLVFSFVPLFILSLFPLVLSLFLFVVLFVSLFVSLFLIVHAPACTFSLLSPFSCVFLW
eukprot:m.286315 g.286315  ORF g.286315 m.286315 type:complete len:71 (-) comp54986_c0_seq5:21-233(-)